MLKNFFGVTFVALPLLVVAATAQAGSTITDKSYWPNEAKRSQASVVERTEPSAAFASEVYAPLPLRTTPMIGNLGRYQGGPKGK